MSTLSWIRRDEITRSWKMDRYQSYFFENFRLFRFFFFFADRPANKTRAKIDELVFFGVTEYFIRKDRADRSIGTRQWIDDGDSSPPHQENKQRLRSRGIKAVYIEMSFRRNYLKRCTRTALSAIFTFSLISPSIPPVRMIKWIPELSTN